MSNEYSFINKCNCCPDYQNSCVFYLPSINKKIIKDLLCILKKYNSSFDNNTYLSFIEEIAEILKDGNVSLNKKGFIEEIFKEI